jgi:hypothetical protein
MRVAGASANTSYAHLRGGVKQKCDNPVEMKAGAAGTPILLKFKLAAFLFGFNPSRSNKGFALCRSIERQGLFPLGD